MMETVTDQEFAVIKAACIALWRTFDDTHGYATEKITEVNRINNVGDNWSYLVAMFDQGNRRAVTDILYSAYHTVQSAVIKAMEV